MLTSVPFWALNVMALGSNWGLPSSILVAGSCNLTPQGYIPCYLSFLFSSTMFCKHIFPRFDRMDCRIIYSPRICVEWIAICRAICRPVCLCCWSWSPRGRILEEEDACYDHRHIYLSKYCSSLIIHSAQTCEYLCICSCVCIYGRHWLRRCG